LHYLAEEASMKKLVVSGLAIALVGLMTARIEAFGHGGGCCHGVCVCMVDRAVTCYKPVFKTEQYTVTVNKIVCKEVCEKKTITVMVPKEYEERRTKTVCCKVPKEIEKEVKKCRIQKVEVVDPCTGCKTTVCKPVVCVEKVKCTVYENVPKTEEYCVKVCKMEPVCKQIDVRKKVRECVPETQTRCRTVCHMVAYQTCIKVPVVVPCCPRSCGHCR
jgi:hypothetical protein